MSRFGLIPRTLTALTAVGLALLAIVCVVMWDHTSEQDRQNRDTRARSVAEHVARALADPLQQDDLASLRHRAAALVIPDVLSLEIESTAGSASSPSPNATHSALAAEAPVLVDGRTVAMVRVLMDAAPDVARQHQHLAWMIGLGVMVIAALNALIASLLTTLVLRPVAKLKRMEQSTTPPHDPLLASSAAPELRHLSQHLAAQHSDRFQRAHHHTDTDALDHAILSAIGEGVITIDAEQRITALNPIAERLTGCSAQHARNRPWPDVLVRADADSKPNPLAADLAAGSVASAGHRLTIISTDGQRRTVLARIARLSDNPGAVLVLRDITEQLDLEERLRRAEKLEDLGRMAGGVAHDFNNLLTGIITASEMLDHHCRSDATAQHFTTLILRSSEQAADLTRQLLRFARNSRPERTKLDLHDVLRHAVTVVEKAPGVPASLHLHLLAPRPTILGNNALLSAVFINLGLNARDAMPRGGALCIATREVEILAGDEVLAPFRLRPGPYLAVTITDTGVGMDEATRSRLFQPFFTTKRPGKGTGLGLATCYATLRDHGGAITVTSAVDCGSTFTVYLPLDLHQDSSATHPAVQQNTEVRTMNDE